MSRLRPWRSYLGCALALALAVEAACGSAQHPVSAVSAEQQQLQGSWLLTSFTPEKPLEPPLLGLFNAQLGALVATFESGGRFSAIGPGLTLNGTYEITSGANGLLSLAIRDSVGVSYRVNGQFEGAILHFQSLDSPWRGSGTLQRKSE